MIRQLSFALSALALSVSGEAVVAAPAALTSPVVMEGRVQLEKTVEVDGVKKLVLAEPSVVVPGDRLLFTTTYRNDGAQSLADFVVTNPLPAAVEVLPDSFGPARVSVDGGKTWGALASLTVADGKGGKRAATGGDVTHLRWVVASILPGAQGSVQYHAVVR
jgi:uncharacterized repeat protein (TIGR01451 family)